MIAPTAPYAAENSNRANFANAKEAASCGYGGRGGEAVELIEEHAVFEHVEGGGDGRGPRRAKTPFLFAEADADPQGERAEEERVDDQIDEVDDEAEARVAERISAFPLEQDAKRLVRRSRKLERHDPVRRGFALKRHVYEHHQRSREDDQGSEPDRE